MEVSGLQSTYGSWYSLGTARSIALVRGTGQRSRVKFRMISRLASHESAGARSGKLGQAKISRGLSCVEIADFRSLPHACNAIVLDHPESHGFPTFPIGVRFATFPDGISQ